MIYLIVKLTSGPLIRVVASASLVFGGIIVAADSANAQTPQQQQVELQSPQTGLIGGSNIGSGPKMHGSGGSNVGTAGQVIWDQWCSEVRSYLVSAYRSQLRFVEEGEYADAINILEEGIGLALANVPEELNASLTRMALDFVSEQMNLYKDGLCRPNIESQQIQTQQMAKCDVARLSRDTQMTYYWYLLSLYRFMEDSLNGRDAAYNQMDYSWLNSWFTKEEGDPTFESTIDAPIQQLVFSDPKKPLADEDKKRLEDQGSFNVRQLRGNILKFMTNYHLRMSRVINREGNGQRRVIATPAFANMFERLPFYRALEAAVNFVERDLDKNPRDVFPTMSSCGRVELNQLKETLKTEIKRVLENRRPTRPLGERLSRLKNEVEQAAAKLSVYSCKP